MPATEKRRGSGPKSGRKSVEAPLPPGNDDAPATMPPSDGRGASRVDESSQDPTKSHRPGGRGDASP